MPCFDVREPLTAHREEPLVRGERDVAIRFRLRPQNATGSVEEAQTRTVPSEPRSVGRHVGAPERTDADVRQLAARASVPYAELAACRRDVVRFAVPAREPLRTSISVRHELTGHEACDESRASGKPEIVGTNLNEPFARSLVHHAEQTGPKSDRG
jgi:hypothetical protein